MVNFMLSAFYPNKNLNFILYMGKIIYELHLDKAII